MRTLLLLLIALFIPGMASAQVYKWTDENGQVHFGTQPPPGKKKEVRIRESSPGAMGSERQGLSGESDIIRQNRELDRNRRRQNLEAAEHRYERRVSEIRRDQIDRPDYVCAGAKNRVKDWEQRWKDKRRQGYTISEETYHKRRIREEERHRDNICR